MLALNANCVWSCDSSVSLYNNLSVWSRRNDVYYKTFLIAVMLFQLRLNYLISWLHVKFLDCIFWIFVSCLFFLAICQCSLLLLYYPISFSKWVHRVMGTNEVMGVCPVCCSKQKKPKKNRLLLALGLKSHFWSCDITLDLLMTFSCHNTVSIFTLLTDASPGLQDEARLRNRVLP